MRRGLPDSIGGRVILILLIGLGASHVGSIWLYEAGGHGPVGDHEGLLVSTTAMALGILAVSILLVRGLTAPLRTLAEAADRLGSDMAAPPIEERGPREVRQAAHAFNRMQARLQRMVGERTQTLAAVSHDLRTPITRLRLRADLVEDETLQRAIIADLTEMEAMIDGALAFLRGASDEESRPVDIVALLSTVIAEAADAGQNASLADPAPVTAVIIGRPLLLKRALANLVDNAIKHGGAARAAVANLPSAVLVRICDPGQGIPTAERDSIFAPFRRLNDQAEGPPGSGLGLTVAQTVVEAHGGAITFEDPPGGGFCVVVTLPPWAAPRTPAGHSAHRNTNL